MDNRFAEGDEVLVGGVEHVVRDGKLVEEAHKPRESSKSKRARARGTFTPTKATGYNRKQRQSIAIEAVREGKAELLDAGCDLLEARKEAVNPHRVSVSRILKSVWKKRKLERESKSTQRKTVEQ